MNELIFFGKERKNENFIKIFYDSYSGILLHLDRKIYFYILLI